MIRSATIYKTLLIWPYAVAPAVAGVLWLFLFNPTLGIVAHWLQGLGIPWDPLLDGTHALIMVVVAAVETTPGVPPTPAILAALPQQMKHAGVRLLIAEPSSAESVVRQIATQSGARRVTLVPSVGADPAATDYLTLFDVNIARLTTALAGAN